MLHNKIRHSLILISLFFVSISVLVAGCGQIKTQTTSISSTIVTTTINVPTITVEDAYSLVKQNLNNPDFVILDVRTAGEFNAGHTERAINLDYKSPKFTTDVTQLDKNKEYMVYCATGVRGAAATEIMIHLGFKNVQNMAGGITAWLQDGYPTVALTTTEAISSQTTTTTITTTGQSGNGLQLQVSVNAATLTSGEHLQINVSEYNTLPTYNNMAAATNWGVNGLAIGACPNINVLPFGVAVFQGHYDARNISQGTPLVLFEAVPCVQLIRLITGYDFLPDSSNAAIMPGGDIASPTPMSATETVTGTYSKGIQLTPLASGIYTVVAGDEWGALEFLYINVK
jgi:rhodanese-related sulfurtransferase